MGYIQNSSPVPFQRSVVTFRWPLWSFRQTVVTFHWPLWSFRQTVVTFQRPVGTFQRSVWSRHSPNRLQTLAIRDRSNSLSERSSDVSGASGRPPEAPPVVFGRHNRLSEAPSGTSEAPGRPSERPKVVAESQRQYSRCCLGDFRFSPVDTKVLPG